MDVLKSVENIAVLGVLAGAVYVAYRFLSGNQVSATSGENGPCGGWQGLPGLLCNLGVWTTGYKAPTGDSLVTTTDNHGCLTGITEWCDTLKHCQPVGLTCPRPSRPYQPEYEYDSHGCKVGIEQFCDVTNQCLDKNVYSENFCKVHEDLDPAPVTRISDMCYFQGEPVLTVPPGKSCDSAIADMCKRFGPDSKWCGMV